MAFKMLVHVLIIMKLTFRDDFEHGQQYALSKFCFPGSCKRLPDIEFGNRTCTKGIIGGSICIHSCAGNRVLKVIITYLQNRYSEKCDYFGDIETFVPRLPYDSS